MDLTYPTLDGGFNVVTDQCMKQCKAINLYISESAVKKKKHNISTVFEHW